MKGVLALLLFLAVYIAASQGHRDERGHGHRHREQHRENRRGHGRGGRHGYPMQETERACNTGRDCGRGHCCVKTMRSKRQVEPEPATTASSEAEVATTPGSATGMCRRYRGRGEGCRLATNRLRWRLERVSAVADCPCWQKEGGVRFKCRANRNTTQSPDDPEGTCQPRHMRRRGEGRRNPGKGRDGQGKGDGDREARRRDRHERRRHRTRRPGCPGCADPDCPFCSLFNTTTTAVPP